MVCVTTLRIETPRTMVLDYGKILIYYWPMKRPDLAQRNTTHGLSQSCKSEYRSWKDMRGRCNRPNNKDYKDYGARGIIVCERWNDFALFYNDMGPKPYGHTID